MCLCVCLRGAKDSVTAPAATKEQTHSGRSTISIKTRLRTTAAGFLVLVILLTLQDYYNLQLP